MTREQDRIQERHQYGMCGGDCFECHKQQEAERQRQNYEDAQQIDYERIAALEKSLSDEMDRNAANVARAGARIAALESELMRLAGEESAHECETGKAVAPLVASQEARIAALEEALRDLVAAGRALGPWLLKSRPADGFPIQIATDWADALIAAERLSNTATRRRNEGPLPLAGSPRHDPWS